MNVHNTLFLWGKISAFLTIIIIDDTVDYEHKLASFIKNSKEVYKVEREILTKDLENPGGNENFWTHWPKF